MHVLETALLMLLAVALVGAIGVRVRAPLPILLVVAGIALSFYPPLARVELDPQLFFLLFIPPLLFADGWLFPKREFKRLRYSIVLLAVGLVTATTLVVGFFVHWLIPSIPLPVAFALGAVVSPTDTVAVAEITQKLKVPLRVNAVVNGESLVNDATGLVAFKFAIAAAVTATFSLPAALGEFVFLAGGGVAIGFVVTYALQTVRLFMQRRGVTEPGVLVTISLLTPFAAYLAAEAAGVSSILSVVVAGITAGLHDSRHLLGDTRTRASSVWSMVLYVLNGLVFLLLGLQLRNVLAGIQGRDLGQLGLEVVAVSLVVVLLRIVWMFPMARVAWVLNRIHTPSIAKPKDNEIFIVAWAGIRGAVTLAAAFSLPQMAGDRPFPERDLVIFLAAGVIVFTLLVNGTTLAWFIRKLCITDDGVLDRERSAARHAIARAGIDRLARHAGDTDRAPLVAALSDQMERHVVVHGPPGHASAEQARTSLSIERELRLAALEAQRSALLDLRDRDEINDVVLYELQQELDNLEAVITTATTITPSSSA